MAISLGLGLYLNGFIFLSGLVVGAGGMFLIFYFNDRKSCG